MHLHLTEKQQRQAILGVSKDFIQVVNEALPEGATHIGLFDKSKRSTIEAALPRRIAFLHKKLQPGLVDCIRAKFTLGAQVKFDVVETKVKCAQTFLGVAIRKDGSFVPRHSDFDAAPSMDFDKAVQEMIRQVAKKLHEYYRKRDGAEDTAIIRAFPNGRPDILAFATERMNAHLGISGP